MSGIPKIMHVSDTHYHALLEAKSFCRILKCGRHVYLQWNRLIKGPAGIGGRRASSRVSNERPIYDGMFFSDG